MVKKLDNFVKSIMGQSAQVVNQDVIMKKFQQKILYVLGALSRLWKGLEDIKNVPDDFALVEDHIKLIEQFFRANRRTRFCIVDVCKY